MTMSTDCDFFACATRANGSSTSGNGLQRVPMDKPLQMLLHLHGLCVYTREEVTVS